MFVRITRYEPKPTEETPDIAVSDAIYQCTQVRFRDVLGKAMDKATGEDEQINELLVEMEGVLHNNYLAVRIEKKGSGVYVMNDNGKTIESFQFK